jgi:hypothetical protein
MRVKTARGKAAIRDTGNQKIRNSLIIGVILFGVVGLLSLLYFNLREPGEMSGVVRYPGLSRAHDESYVHEPGDLPPAGGIHYGAWQNCGVYREPVETGYALHSLEHGAVWITYNEQLSESDITRLEGLASGRSHILVSPYPSQRSPVVLTAWGVQLEANSANDRRIPDFIDRYLQGPLTPERGGSCANGVGEPIR